MLDSAVTWFGITIENALQERVKVQMGTTVEYRPKYTLARLLSLDFKLPRPVHYTKPESTNVWAPLLAWAGRPGSGVKRYRYMPPTEKSEGKDG